MGLDKILNNISKENDIKKIIAEGKYSRLRQHMAGLTNVKTITLVTAENPTDLALPEEKEKSDNYRNALLEKQLKEQLYGYNRLDHKGSKFLGVPETSYAIYNISREVAIGLARTYSQNAVVWGEKIQSKDELAKFRWEMIVDKSKQSFKYDKFRDYQTDDIKETTITLEKDAEDNYSQLGKRRFVVPFYDEKYDVKEGYVFNIFDISSQKPPSFLDLNTIDKVEKDIKERQKILENKKSGGKTYYYARGALRRALGILKYLEESIGG